MNSGPAFFVLGLIPLALIIAFTGLEFAIGIIQAQVFVILSCSYIKDGLELHGDSDSHKTTTVTVNNEARRV